MNKQTVDNAAAANDLVMAKITEGAWVRAYENPANGDEDFTWVVEWVPRVTAVTAVELVELLFNRPFVEDLRLYPNDPLFPEQHLLLERENQILGRFPGTTLNTPGNRGQL